MRINHLIISRAARLSLGALSLLLFASCDTSVTNPGLTPDESLDKPEAWAAVVIGARRALADAIGSTAGGQLLYWSAAVSFELNPAGSTGSFGIPPDVQGGIVNEDRASGDWSPSNQARFVAEDGVRRFKKAMPDTIFAKSPLVAQAYLYAGYANRQLGENFCESVIPITNADGTLSPGNLGSNQLYWYRADTAFSNALATATAAGNQTALVWAARMGRAAVRADLATYGKATWASVGADAVGIPDTASFVVAYSAANTDQYNYLYWAGANTPYRAHTEWGTWYEIYNRANRTDTRVKWDSLVGGKALTGDAAVAKFGGLVPFWRQSKYAAQAASVRLSSGWEMRLLEAEAALVAGDTATARARMNGRRTALGLPGVTFTSPTEAWTALKTERAIELWLETRRLGDIRRWLDNSVPGSLVDGLYRANATAPLSATPLETMAAPVQRSKCFPIGRNERETNPNF